MAVLRNLTRFLPFAFDCTGKHLPFLCGALKDIFPLPRLCNLPDGITADTANAGEKLLSMFFFNIIRHYKNSPLFVYMQKHINRGDVFLDIGAYLGIYSYLAILLGAKPVLFEANPACLSFLERNHHLFHNLFPFAIWDKDDKREFFIGKDSDMGSSSLVNSLKPWASSCYKTKIRVCCRSLESIMPSHLWEKVSLVKIDVEGAEDRVLQGFADELGKHDYHIWCEVRDNTSDRNPGSFTKVCDLAEKNGYSINFFDGEKLRPFNNNHIGRVFDLLLIPVNG